MNHKQLEEFISKKQKVSDRNFQAFQESGIPRYMYAYQRAEYEIYGDPVIDKPGWIRWQNAVEDEIKRRKEA